MRQRVADEVLEDLFLREIESQLAQHLSQRAIGDGLAVHQHAVAIEDDQLRALHPRTQRRSSRPKPVWTSNARMAAGIAPSRISPRSSSRMPVRIGWP